MGARQLGEVERGIVEVEHAGAASPLRLVAPTRESSKLRTA